MWAIYISLKVWLLSLLVFGIAVLPIFPLEIGNSQPKFPVKAVNLGGWLVTEGWIKPSLFDGILNKHFLDGTKLRFKSAITKKCLGAEFGGGSIIVADSTKATDSEYFKLWRINPTTFLFRVSNNKFVGLDENGILVATKDSTDAEKFEIIEESNKFTPAKADESNDESKECEPDQTDESNKQSKKRRRVRFKASNGWFLQVKYNKLVIAVNSEAEGWEDDDPTVFWMTIGKTEEGEYQVTNGYGPHEAPKVMKEHWNSFIVEDDFKFIAENGLNAIRIPVGWWTAKDPNPPAPYVGGSLQVLDNAFSWAQKYGLKVILDLHAAPGAQNYGAHCSSRDGSIEWGKTDENIQQTIDVIDFLTARYANSESLYAVELLNEPLAPEIPIESLIKYYKAGYNAVRNHSSEAYVILSARLSFYVPDTHWHMELFPLAHSLQRSVIDIHWYSTFYCIFKSMYTAQKNINYIRNNRASQLNYLDSNGPLLFIGEWSAMWHTKNPTKEDYQQFTKAKLEVYEKATFGWSFWTFKIDEKELEKNEHLRPWSLKWMIENGYINLGSFSP